MQISPRDVLLTILNQAAAASAPPKNIGFKDIATEVRGEISSQPITLRLDTSAWPHPDWGISGGRLLVASPPAIVGRWLANRKLHRPGVWAPEQIVEGSQFFEELSQRGVKTTLSRTETLVAGAATGMPK